MCRRAAVSVVLWLKPEACSVAETCNPASVGRPYQIGEKQRVVMDDLISVRGACEDVSAPWRQLTWVPEEVLLL